MANLAFRSGLPTATKDITSRVSQCDHASETVRDIASHITANDVDLSRNPMGCSPWMEYDPQKMEFSGSNYGASIANALVKPTYREPFVVPAHV
jgi:hypothetical protein